MHGIADRLNLMQRQLISRVRIVLDEIPPELSESAIGRMAQAGALVELAAEHAERSSRAGACLPNGRRPSPRARRPPKRPPSTRCCAAHRRPLISPSRRRTVASTRFSTSRTVAASCVSNPFRCISANATSREVMGSCPAQRVEDHPEQLALREPLPPLPPHLRHDGVGVIARSMMPDRGVEMQDVGAQLLQPALGLVDLARQLGTLLDQARPNLGDSSAIVCSTPIVCNTVEH